MNKQTIRIKYFTDKIEKLTYIDGKSDWIDLRAADDLCLKKGDFALVPLGIAMVYACSGCSRYRDSCE